MFSAKHPLNRKGIKNKLGSLGEAIAADFLMKKGFKILKRNHREGFDEIDIIAHDPKLTLVFIEVKTMNQAPQWIDDPITPEQHLTQFKLLRLERAARRFVSRVPSALIDKYGWRMDLIAMVLKEGEIMRLDHYENIDS